MVFALVKLGYPNIPLYVAETGWPSGERHFGLLYPNESHIYDIDLSETSPDWTYDPLPKPTNNEPYKVQAKIGVCYGQLGNNLPTPSTSVQYLQNKLKAPNVKIYDATPSILNALKGTNLTITIMVPNEKLGDISSDQHISDQWVKTNVLPFYPQTKITVILVGNEILSPWNNQYKFYLVPAMNKIYQSLKTFGLHNAIKVGTPIAFDALESSVFRPSNGTFRSDISIKFMKPMLHFLNSTKSYFFVDLYPYFEWVDKPKKISLNYALLSAKNTSFKDPVSGLVYHNLLDQMLDSMVFAMTKLGYPNIPLYIAETGWPSDGDYDQIGANIYNAATYNRNIVKKFTAKPPVGTPARPGEAIDVNIFALYNENQKWGPTTERHFGLLYPSGDNVYGIDLSGKTSLWTYKPLPKPTNNQPYKGKIWCVVSEGANLRELRRAMDSICGDDKKICAAIKPGGICYKPNRFLLHASYVFSSYWAKNRNNGTYCFFNGLAAQTIKDPSYNMSCQFPSVRL
ncbi:OLC1v1021321C1 [Oldenlandia corymbosa var. corymbosa]|uniref:glucan endo-1,3-beta-D-glucosidase n=1 Tax=Oldenlandia corymbosa var. corymbosa TaxID=529605 RepID=A0AAV1BVE1_OLDCO|nr:OLC1v1021321C1 [Oldenlandia corymbosa var. corymbosa]